ncbi:glycosyltransferase [Demequina lignilytica]|uniref:Glycosyltransferase n=1 Tax=Demequina lignilytica TaxID=3051663 RepID=A0AB35MKB1_9MICO|nr:glycosyltransferase [Demequina sp. SYSU T0a273]MDN4484187.1 glycosyltransferase [Demequina sp. SYSU T0a273]
MTNERKHSILVVVAESLRGGLAEMAMGDAALGLRLGYSRAFVLGPDGANAADAPPGVTVIEAPIPSALKPDRQLAANRRSLRRQIAALEDEHGRATLHIHGLRPALLLASLLRRPIVTYHGAVGLPDGSATTELVRRATMRLIPQFAISALSVVPNGMAGWTVVWQRQAVEASRAGKPRSAGVRLLWLGRVSAQKDFATFINVVRRLRDTGVELEARVAGDIDLASHDAVEAQAAGIELLGHVRDVGALLRQDVIVCLFSHFEGRPLAVEQAIEAGCPVVVSDLPGNRMMVEDSRFLVHGIGEAVSAVRALGAPEARADVAAAQHDYMAGSRGRCKDYSTVVGSLYRRLGRLSDDASA